MVGAVARITGNSNYRTVGTCVAFGADAFIAHIIVCTHAYAYKNIDDIRYRREKKILDI